MLDAALRPPPSIEEFTAGMAAVLEVQAANTNHASLFGEAFDGSVGENPRGTVCVGKAACEAIASSDFHMPTLQADNRVKCPYYRQIIGFPGARLSADNWATPLTRSSADNLAPC